MVTYCIYCAYGIEVINNGISEGRTKALFDNVEEAEQYTRLFNRLKLSPIHLKDVIFDIKYEKL